MDRVIKWLLATKGAFLIMAAPWLALHATGGSISLFLVVAVSLAGAAMWGFSYGVIHNEYQHK